MYRTDLIEDPAVLAKVDAQPAANVARWPSMTRGRLSGAIDRIVIKADRDAVRARKQRQIDREIAIGEACGGLCRLEGALFSPDAHALDNRLNALADTVCPHDPRTRDQRRADALGALAANADRLGCRCRRPDCAAWTRPPASPVVIHVIAEQATLDGTGSTPASEVAADGLIPPEVIAELAATSRQVALVNPDDVAPEPRYTPSQALADFVRCRDLTCRWPGCDRPARDCDLDHTIPYAQGGPTHAANLKCYCRLHHLLKVFWGWRDQQQPDGTAIWTAHTGKTYKTAPGRRIFFPAWQRTTAELPPRPIVSAHIRNRRVMMPTRPHPAQWIERSGSSKSARSTTRSWPSGTDPRRPSRPAPYRRGISPRIPKRLYQKTRTARPATHIETKS